MRRSSSVSNIPLATSLQGKNMEQKNRERSKSTFRYNRERSMDRLTTPVGMPGTVSAHKSSSLKKVLWTPIFSRDSGRSSSLSSRSARPSRARSPFDKKKSQLVNDKKWVNDQYHKILEYIENSGLFNPELADKLRPPTMTIFVELVSVLFEQLLPNPVPITSQNYAEVSVQSLKLLGYPGQLTTTTLKTINTMHGWPQFISVISWLIDRIQVSTEINNAFGGNTDSNVTVEYNKSETFYKFLYTLYPGNADVDDVQLQNGLEQFREDLNLIMGTDVEMSQKNQELLQCMGAELTELSDQIQDLEKRNAKIQQENMHRQKTIDDYEQNKDNWLQEIEAEIVKLTENGNRLALSKDALVLSIKELKKCIATQPFSVNDKNELLTKIQDRMKSVQRKTEKLNEYRLVRDQLDLELDTVLHKVEKKVDQWNISITKSFLPELECLRLRERGFAGFLEEIVATRKSKGIIEAKLHTEYMESLAELEKLHMLEESLKENRKTIDASQHKLGDLRNAIQAMHKENRLLIADIEEVSKNHQEKLNQIRESEERKIDEQNVAIKKLNDGQQQVSTKKQSIVKSGIAVLVETRALMIHTMNEIEEKIVALSNEASNSSDESRKFLQATFEHLLKLKNISEQLVKYN